MSGVDHYRKEYSSAKSHLKKVLQLLETHQLPDTELLQGRALYYMSAVYRERKKFGTAEKYIEESMRVIIKH